MHRLRSRWTVVALVPAFFLTGFAVVSALADSDASTPAVARPASGEEETAAAPATVPPATTVLAPTQGGATTDAATTTVEEGDDDSVPVGGGGDWPASMAPGTIQVDYGRWEGLFELEASEIVPEIGLATVTGELRYFGGADCQLGRVEIRGRFYNAAGQQIGPGAWNSTWVTGEGAEVPTREPLYVEFYGTVGESAEAAYLRFTKVECL
ncbi:MAG: hypothetical protein ACRDNI_03725 [Gaiellaceae bacterium]